MLAVHQSEQATDMDHTMSLDAESDDCVYYRCMACCEVFFTLHAFYTHARLVHCKMLVTQGHNPGNNDDDNSLENDEPGGTSGDEGNFAGDKQGEHTSRSDYHESANTSSLSTAVHMRKSPATSRDESSRMESCVMELQESAEVHDAVKSIKMEILSPQLTEESIDAASQALDMDADGVEQVHIYISEGNKDDVVQPQECGAMVTLPFSLNKSPGGSSSKKKRKKAPGRVSYTTVLDVAEREEPLKTEISGSGEEALYGRHSLDATAAAFKCGICGAAFLEARIMRHHMRLHANSLDSDKKHVCNVCNRSFRRADTLVVHIRTHTREKPYKCNICHNAFSQAGALHRHLRTHTSNRPFECDLCGEILADPASFKQHMCSQSGERPHKCKYCASSFKSRHFLVKHEVSHLPPSENVANQPTG